MWIKSEVDKGSVFYFTIPYNTGSINEKSIAMVENKKTDTTSIQILVVEDDETNFILIREILKANNIEIIHAKTGIEAIEMYKRNNKINLVLMDIKLPDISGIELTRQLLSIRKNTPIIAQTAYALEGDKENALKAGCVDYIAKPIISDELIKKVKKYALAN